MDFLKMLGIDEQTARNIADGIGRGLENLEGIRGILAREYGEYFPGISPAAGEQEDRSLAERPLVIDETTISGEKELQVAAMMGGLASQGIIANTHNSAKVQVQWTEEEEGAYTNSFTLAVDEVLDLNGFFIYKLKVIPVGSESSFKMILR